MIDCCARWHIVALVIALSACTSSHGPEECVHTSSTTCWDACCDRTAPVTFDDACNPTCAAGFHLEDLCTRTAECAHDAGCPAPSDAGSLPPCLRGPCCNEVVSPERDGCLVESCPAGSSWTCEPDPAADCIPRWLAPCDTPADCVIAPAECCFTCGEPTLDDVVGIHALGEDEYVDTSCAGGGGACVPCEPPASPYPYLVATCAAEACTAIDVRTHAVSACTDDEDCRLRVPECCECGAIVVEDQLIAIHLDQGGEYAALVCDLAATDCAPCGAVYPDTVEAYCGGDGHCAIRAVP